MSATYRQIVQVRRQRSPADDPENKLLAAGRAVAARSRVDPRQCAEGERPAVARRSAGRACSRRSPRVTTDGTYGGLRWKTSPGEDRYRRGLYTFTKRTAPFAMFGTFDGPSGEACVARREVSNTPLQALTLLNDVAFVEAAQTFGKQLASATGTTEEKVASAVATLSGAAPDRRRTASVAQFFEAQRKRLTDKSGELGGVDRRPRDDARIDRSSGWASRCASC